MSQFECYSNIITYYMYASGSVTETATGRAVVPHNKPQLSLICRYPVSVGRKHRINMSTSSTNLNFTYPTWIKLITILL